MTEPDPYRKGTRYFTEHEYRDGYIVWNYMLVKWDYFGESQR